jgi:hypothetical protein
MGTTIDTIIAVPPITSPTSGPAKLTTAERPGGMRAPWSCVRPPQPVRITNGVAPNARPAMAWPSSWKRIAQNTIGNHSAKFTHSPWAWLW